MKRRLICSMFAAVLFFAPLAQQAAATASDSTIVSFAPSLSYVADNSSSDLPPSSSFTSSSTASYFDYFASVKGSGSSTNTWTFTKYFMSSESSPYFREGSDIIFDFSSDYWAFCYNKSGVGSTYSNTSGSQYYLWIYLLLDDGVYHCVLNKKSLKSGNSFSFTVSADDVSSDVFGFAVYFSRPCNGYSGFVDNTGRVGFKPDSITISGSPVKVLGFLSSILQAIQSVIDGILSLPQKIVDLLSSALQSLFVPSQDDLNSLFDTFGDSFKTKLGFLWQAGEIVTGFWDGLTNQEEAGTIDFPGISLSFGGATFSVPAQSVSLWPGGLDSLKTPVRLASTSALVFLWIRGLLRRLDAILNPGGD